MTPEEKFQELLRLLDSGEEITREDLIRLGVLRVVSEEEFRTEVARQEARWEDQA